MENSNIKWTDLFALIDATPNLDWLLLTKRPENIVLMWPWDTPSNENPERLIQRSRSNVWLGTSVENQAAADARIPHLLKAAHLCRFTFLSCEPLLGPVNLNVVPASSEDYWPMDVDGPGPHWVIAGGESGKNARPMHPDWVRSLRDQCKATGVAFLFKQWGEWKPLSTIDGKQQVPFGYYVLPNADGTGGFGFTKVGKHAAGRLLDGVEHNGFPQ